MLKFNEFLNEQNEVITVDTRHLENNADAINADLDKLTEKPYQNAPIFLAQLRGTLERYGMLIPATATPYFLNLNAEVIYVLGESKYHLYIVYDTNEHGFVDGYAQVVTADELNALIGMDPTELVNTVDDAIYKARYLPARRDDDSGNTSEY